MVEHNILSVSRKKNAPVLTSFYSDITRLWTGIWMTAVSIDSKMLWSIKVSTGVPQSCVFSPHFYSVLNPAPIIKFTDNEVNDELSDRTENSWWDGVKTSQDYWFQGGKRAHLSTAHQHITCGDAQLHKMLRNFPGVSLPHSWSRKVSRGFTCLGDRNIQVFPSHRLLPIHHWKHLDKLHHLTTAMWLTGRPCNMVRVVANPSL